MRVELNQINIIMEAEVSVTAEVPLDDALDSDGYGDREDFIQEAIDNGEYEIQGMGPESYAWVGGVVGHARFIEFRDRAYAAEAELKRLGIERDEKGVFRSASKRGQAS